MSTTSPLTWPANEHPVLTAAIGLQPLVRQYAEATESNRALAPEVVAAFRNAGLFHLLVAKEYGGIQADPVTAARVVEEIAAADGSSGWCMMIGNQNGCLASGLLAPEHAMEVVGNGGIGCGTARPIGRAVAVDGGYRVSGRWPFASGSSHADWFGGECVVYDGDAPRKDANGNDVSRMTFMRRAEVTIHDTWDTLGLRGTASNDFSADDVFVPEARGMQMLVTPPQHPWPLYEAPGLMFVNHGSHALGVARGALENATAIAKAKSGYGSDRPMSENQRVQLPVAEATVLIESARHYLYNTTEQLWADVELGKQDTAQLRARVRLATSHAASASVRAVDTVHTALATAAVFRKNPIERQFRDIHTAAAHVMIGVLTYEAAGRVEMGLEAEFPFF